MQSSQYPKRKNPRLINYDYSLAGMYFLTICTKDMKSYFGDIVGLEMQLSVLGKIVEDVYKQHIASYSSIDDICHVVMPNHFHCLVLLKEHQVVSVQQFVRSFKAKVSQECNRRILKGECLDIDGRIWQQNFHDHVVRDNEDYQNIANYIVKNPERWNNDCFNENRHIPSHPKQ